MSNGQPLTDEDREPWLERIRKTAEQHAAEMQNGTPSSRGVVVTCSALKTYYRDILRGRLKPFSTHTEAEALLVHAEPPDPDVFPTYFVFITGKREVIHERMKNRKGHYMKADMLQSQLDALESPEGEDGVVTVDVEESTESQVRKAEQALLVNGL